MANSHEFRGVLVEDRILYANFDIGKPVDEVGFVDEVLSVTPLQTAEGMLRLIDETTSELLGRLSLADEFSSEFRYN